MIHLYKFRFAGLFSLPCHSPKYLVNGGYSLRNGEKRKNMIHLVSNWHKNLILLLFLFPAHCSKSPYERNCGKEEIIRSWKSPCKCHAPYQRLNHDNHKKDSNSNKYRQYYFFHNNSFSFIRTDYSALCLREYSYYRVQAIVLRTRFLHSPISICEYSSTSCIVFRFSPSNPDLLRSCDGVIQVNPSDFIIAVNCRPAPADLVKVTLFSVLFVYSFKLPICMFLMYQRIIL